MLDGAFIHRRRIELGLSERALARAGGGSFMLVRSIEAGAACPAMTLADLGRLADALGVAPVQLIQHPVRPSNQDAPDHASPDVAVLGALLWRARRLTPLARLARGLGWDQAHVRGTADALRAHLAGAGLTVHELHGAIEIRPLVLDTPELDTAIREARASEDLTRVEAEALRRVVFTDIDERAVRARAAKAVFTRLTEAGLIHWEEPASPLDRKRIRVDADVLFSLGLVAPDVSLPAGPQLFAEYADDGVTPEPRTPARSG